MEELPPLIQLAVVVFGSGGAAWASVKATLNGTAKRVERIEEKMDTVRDVQAAHGERLASIEAGRRKNDP